MNHNWRLIRSQDPIACMSRRQAHHIEVSHLAHSCIFHSEDYFTVFQRTVQEYLVYSKISLCWSVFNKFFIPIPNSIFIIIAPKSPSVFVIIGFDTLSLNQEFTNRLNDSEVRVGTRERAVRRLQLTSKIPDFDFGVSKSKKDIFLGRHEISITGICQACRKSTIDLFPLAR